LEEIVGLASYEEPIGLFQSGGLSALAVGIWLHEQRAATQHYIADIGQADRSELELLASSLKAFGAEVKMVDLRAEMAQMAADLLRYRARHDGGYWNTTGAARFVLVNGLAPIMRADGCRTLAHGCVGGGNDQRRFARYSSQVTPELAVISPWTDADALERFPDRTSMIKAVAEHGLHLDDGSSVDRSTDANLAGSAHESAQLEDLQAPVTSLDPRWSRWPAQAALGAESVNVTFLHGRISDVEGSGSEPLAWMTRANEIGARHGIWLRDVVERRIIGTVSRGVYESPGLELVERAWTRILQASLDAAGRQLYDHLSSVVGAAAYEARWLEPAAQAARVAIDDLVGGVSGTVTLSVRQGNVSVERTDVSSRVVQQTRFGSGGGNRWSQVAA
jgi:argininosuccinate synthase